jgi:hypothetical protein
MNSAPERSSHTAARGGECVSCGYRLDGLADDGACPECGLPIARTRQRSLLLRGADDRFLTQVHRGLVSLEAAMYLLLAAAGVALLFILLDPILRSILGRPRLVWPQAVADVLVITLAGAAAAAHTAACALLGVSSSRWDAPSTHVRLGVLIGGPLLVLAGAGTFYYRLQLATMFNPAHAVVRALIEATVLAVFFALAALLEHYQKRTIAWGAEPRLRYASLRRNLYFLIGAVLLQDWFLQLPLLSGGTGGVPMMLLGIAYVLFVRPVARARSAVGMERIIGRETGGRAGAERPAWEVEALMVHEQLEDVRRRRKERDGNRTIS